MPTNAFLQFYISHLFHDYVAYLLAQWLEWDNVSYPTLVDWCNQVWPNALITMVME